MDVGVRTVFSAAVHVEVGFGRLERMGKVDVAHPTQTRRRHGSSTPRGRTAPSVRVELPYAHAHREVHSTVERGLKKSKQNRLSGIASEITPAGRSTCSSERRSPIGSGMCSNTWLAIDASKVPCSSRGTAASRGPWRPDEVDVHDLRRVYRGVVTVLLELLTRRMINDRGEPAVGFRCIGVVSGPSSRIAPIGRSRREPCRCGS